MFRIKVPEVKMRFFGRSTKLGDHSKRLTKLQQEIMTHASTGEPLSISRDRPQLPNSTNLVPAWVIRDAISGKYKSLHHRGLRLEGLYIEGDLDLSFLRWSGELALIACHVTGRVILDHVKVTGRVVLDGSHVRSIRALTAIIEGSLLMRDGFTAEEGFYGLGIRVSESLNLRKSHITGPKRMPQRMAVELFRAHLGDLFLTNATFDGGVYASSITVTRNVRITASTFRSRESLGWPVSGPDFKGALALSTSDIKGSLYISTARTRDSLSLIGPITLRGASCKQIFVDKAALDNCDSVNLDGLTYSRLNGITPDEYLQFLTKCPDIYPEAYVQLATYCQEIGEINTRKRTLIALEKRRTRKLGFGSPSRVSRTIYSALVGYGYHPARAIPWLIGTVLSATWLVSSHGEFLVRKASTLPQSTTNSALTWPESVQFVLDSLLPFAGLGTKDVWVVSATTVSQWLWLTTFLFLKFLAWGLVALSLVSFTNVVRKSH